MKKSEIRKLREMEIIQLLNKLGVADVEIMKRLNVSGLGKTTNRNVLRVLNKMVDDGLLDSMRREIKIFSVAGRGFGHWEHRLLMNKFIVRKGYFHKARIEKKVKINHEVFVPDFYVPLVVHPGSPADFVFYEVDRRQKKKANDKKIERYKRLGLKFEVVCSAERKYMWKGCVVNVVEY